MLFKNAPLAIIGALLATSQVFAAVSVDQHINKMANMATKIQDAKDSLDNYRGGQLPALRVAKSLDGAMTASVQARQQLADGDALTSEEGDKYEESYDQMYPVLLDAIDAAKTKGPLLKDAGLGPISRWRLAALHHEKRLFEEQAQEKVPAQNFNHVKPSADRISKAFDEADAALR